MKSIIANIKNIRWILTMIFIKNYNLNELVGSTGSESGACSEIILI